MIIPLIGVLSSLPGAQLAATRRAKSAWCWRSPARIADKAVVDQRQPVPLHAYVWLIACPIRW